MNYFYIFYHYHFYVLFSNKDFIHGIVTTIYYWDWNTNVFITDDLAKYFYDFMNDF